MSRDNKRAADEAFATDIRALLADGGKGEAVCDRIICWHNRSCVNDDAATMRNCPHRAAPQAECAPREAQPKLTVWYGSLPESNGKTNWTAILHRGDVTEGITIDMSEYPDRTRYEADRMRWMIGELADEPWVLDYDADKHSGYAAPTPERADADTAMTDKEIDALWLRVTGFNADDERADIAGFARAILAANKESQP
jgi:hypothetical protein